MNKQQAADRILDVLPKGSKVVSVIEEGPLFLSIAYRRDPLEGRLDPFFSVDKRTGYVRDFSPQNYENPLDILTRLEEAATDGG